MRGKGLHNHLVGRAEHRFIEAGFKTATEHRVVLPDGRVDYIDLLAWRGQSVIACELETTPRYVVVNATKAAVLGLPLWVLVPTRGVHRAVVRRLRTAGFDCVTPSVPASSSSFDLGVQNFRGKGVFVFLDSLLGAALVNCFPVIQSANTTPENKHETGKQKTEHPGIVPFNPDKESLL